MVRGLALHPHIPQPPPGKDRRHKRPHDSQATPRLSSPGSISPSAFFATSLPPPPISRTTQAAQPPHQLHAQIPVPRPHPLIRVVRTTQLRQRHHTRGHPSWEGPQRPYGDHSRPGLPDQLQQSRLPRDVGARKLRH
ncbi:hypothetical protein GGTG_02043 [Gaeumannomyces tritici R3-111a-1]|uniref:Uncharacterized protein n=1 Tax=Gaeumannomyces tritici (strain R3-111a-1) TaxID=644352 RepID=J3NL95_GAET3|nr:hypothetical protein GGTG_02043 [Gaeumannomyces tritici R3-111a-1]EJT82069.1 hypothetical protein GGTG_02043 [Gaeumannomyces tritici R3-111a-1]